jgi:hypothetical protein
MSQAAPAPISNVPRDEVSDVVGDMMAEDDIKWIAIEFESNQGGIDRFKITPWVTHPMGADVT